jgi:hypothetical protein
LAPAAPGGSTKPLGTMAFPDKRAAGFHDPVLDGKGNRLQLRADPQLEEQILHVGADRQIRQVGRFSNAPIRPADGKQIQELAFSGCQRPHPQLDARVAARPRFGRPHDRLFACGELRVRSPPAGWTGL